MFFLFFSCSEFVLHGDKEVSEEGQPEVVEEVGEDEPIEEEEPSLCSFSDLAAEEVGIGDECSPQEEGSFTPIVEWFYGSNKSCTSLPIVADLNGDNTPDILLNLTQGIIGTGTLTAIAGDGSGLTGLSADSVAFVNITSKPTLISGSSQIDHDATTNFVAGEHFVQ